MYSFLKATFWISVFFVLRNNRRQLMFLLLWVVSFFLTDYFFSGFREIVHDRETVLFAFTAKVLLQLLFIALFLLGVRRLFLHRAKVASELRSNDTGKPLSPMENTFHRNEISTRGKTKKQRIFEKYKANQHKSQPHEGSKNERTDR